MKLLLCLVATLAACHAFPDLGGGCLLALELVDVATDLIPPHVHPSTAPVQELHLSLNGPGKMRAIWLNPTIFKGNIFNPLCAYGLSPSTMNHTVAGTAYSYSEGGFQQTLNTAILDLTIFQSSAVGFPVYYRCGDNRYGWSNTSSFTPQSPGLSEKETDNTLKFKSFRRYGQRNDFKQVSPAPTIALIGDLGVIHGEYTMSSILKRIDTDGVKLLVHAGDISYADKYGHNNSYLWVDYMRQLQPITSRVPYMVAPGNHEAQFQFAAYLNWFQMPTAESGSNSSFWFSFDYMGVHFVSFSTEHHFYPNSTQYQWMEQDLIKANQNRKSVPWIIVFGHRPLYCTSVICAKRCQVEAPRYRFYLEDLLYTQKVDVFLSGHNHQYERSYPVYKENATQKDYLNPKAPVYIVDGGAGNPEINDPTFKPSMSWRAQYDPTFNSGFLLMQPSQSELSFRYITSKTDTVYDNFTIVKTNL